MSTNVVSIFQCPWFLPLELAILHKILNYLCERPRNQNILDHTYLFLTSKTFYSPTLKSLRVRLPLCVPGSAFPASRTGGFWEASRVLPEALNRNAGYDWETTIPRIHWSREHPATTPTFFSSGTFSSVWIWLVGLKKS